MQGAAVCASAMCGPDLAATLSPAEGANDRCSNLPPTLRRSGWTYRRLLFRGRTLIPSPRAVRHEPLRCLHACLPALSHYYAQNVISSKLKNAKEHLIPNSMTVYTLCCNSSKVIEFLLCLWHSDPCITLSTYAENSVEELNFFCTYCDAEIKSRSQSTQWLHCYHKESQSGLW